MIKGEQPTTTGEIKIVPPIGEQVEQKFINYGELDKEDKDDESPMPFNNPVVPVNLDTIRQNALDINAPKKEKGTQAAADLDSLLNLQNISIGPSGGHIPGENEFLTPAEEIVKKDTMTQDKIEAKKDYFKSADFIPNLPTNTMPDSDMSTSSNYTINEAMQKIRDLVSELKTHGIKIESNEMTFENSNQIIINIDKQ